MDPVFSGKLAELSRDVRDRFGADKSGFYLLPKNEEAMMWRLALVDSAERSVDMQYFLWENDDAGRMSMERCLDAAERGVRVRLLVDDFFFNRKDFNVAAASHHPNLEIKIFNPRRVRNGRFVQATEFLLKFGKLNRRMHNKMLVVDNQVAIMGGRNVANAYFGMSESYNFCDLDVLTTGAVIPRISECYEEYWNSRSACPAAELDSRAGPEDTAGVIREFRERFVRHSEYLRSTRFPLHRIDWSDELRSLKTKWHSGTAVVLQDKPDASPKLPGQRLLDMAPRITEEASGDELLVATPYLLPGDEVYERLSKRVKEGVRLRILTGSRGANNQPAVYAHYCRHRRRILRLGAELQELRHDPGKELRKFTDSGPARNQWVALHMKGFTGGRKRCFIGTLNLDPRSIRINTECGLMIHSPGLASEMADHIEFMMATANSWRVTSDKDVGKGALRWKSLGEERRFHPVRVASQRFGDLFLGLLPIADQL